MNIPEWTAGDTALVVVVLLIVAGLSILLNCVAFNCNLSLIAREKNARVARRAERERDRAKEDAAILRKSNANLRQANENLHQSNAMLRQHTVEHCRREAAMKALLEEQGWTVIESAPGQPSLLDEAEPESVESPADIQWGEPR